MQDYLSETILLLALEAQILILIFSLCLEGITLQSDVLLEWLHGRGKLDGPAKMFKMISEVQKEPASKVQL